MSNDTKMGRRALLKKSLAVIGAAAVAPAVLSACGGEEEGLDCSSTAGLTPDQVSTRTSLAYVEASTDPNKTCDKCALYTAAGPNQCGSCSVVAGPINPAGTCNSFAPKTS